LFHVEWRSKPERSWSLSGFGRIPEWHRYTSTRNVLLLLSMGRPQPDTPTVQLSSRRYLAYYSKTVRCLWEPENSNRPEKEQYLLRLLFHVSVCLPYQRQPDPPSRADSHLKTLQLQLHGRNDVVECGPERLQYDLPVRCSRTCYQSQLSEFARIRGLHLQRCCKLCEHD